MGEGASASACDDGVGYRGQRTLMLLLGCIDDEGAVGLLVQAQVPTETADHTDCRKRRSEVLSNGLATGAFDGLSEWQAGEHLDQGGKRSVDGSKLRL